MPRRKRRCTRQEAARELGIPPRTLDRWIERGAPVGPGAGQRYDVEALRQWQAARASSQSSVADLTLERAKLARTQRTLLNLKINEARAVLVRRDDVILEGRTVLLALRGRLLALPRQATLAGLCTVEAEPAFRALVIAALRELSRWSAAQGTDPAAEPEASAVVAGPWSGVPGATS